MVQEGSKTIKKLQTWVRYLKKVHVTHTPGEELKDHLQQKQEKLEEQKQRRQELEAHLGVIKQKHEKKRSLNNLNLTEKRLYRALIDWYSKQEGKIPDGILEFYFKKKKLIRINFEKIEGDIDSTLKIKKMDGSDKLKEMLLIFKRGKDIFLEFYNADIRENIFTFMFMSGVVLSNQKCPEVINVIDHFKKFDERNFFPIFTHK